jgi:class 3 adenylate cyclase/TolB-like protein/Tfp pilus assembly protein PilF
MEPVSRSAVTRKLAAILIADVVGFSRHMERDDAGTFARLREIRERFVDPKIAEYGGRVVKTAGDGMLLEFSSADAALHCAIDVQRAMHADNQSKPSDQRIEFRIGINIGDIIIDGTDIAGDGVNVASRLEALAAPGGICVSSAVREQVHGSLDVGFTDIGEQQVKNIMRPLRVYQVILAGAGAQATVADRSLRARVSPHRRWWISGAALGLAGIVATWLLLPLIKSSPMPADSPPPMSIAILPFAPASDSIADRQYAEQLTSDLTTNVSRNRSATVAPSSLASAFTGKTIDLPSVGRQLNVRYIAEGEIRHTGEKMFVTVRLTDTRTRKQAWSERREYELATLAAKPDTVQLQLTRRLSNALRTAEIQRAASDTATAGPLDLVLRGYAVWNAETTVSGPREARKRFESALQLDPNYVPALIALADSYSEELQFGPNPDRRLFEQKMDTLTGRAVSIDPGNAEAWESRAEALSWLGRWDEALSASERAESIYPWGAGILSWRSWIMISMGRPADALALAQRAAAIDPPGGGFPQLMTCKGYLYLGQYEEAVRACEKSAGLNNSWIDQGYLTAAYAQNGDLNKAKIAKDELLKLQPGYTIDRYRQTFYSGTPAFFDLVEKHLAAGLRKAGIPEK